MIKNRISMILGSVLIIGALFFAGCAPKGPVQSEVSGTVSWQGKPVASGIVNLYSPETGQGGSADLDANGNFTIPKINVGNYQVSIAPPAPAITNPDGTPPKPQPKFLLPEKYHEGETSKLTFEVKAEGDNKLVLDLK